MSQDLWYHMLMNQIIPLPSNSGDDFFFFCTNCLRDWDYADAGCGCPISSIMFWDDTISATLVFPSNTFLLTHDLTKGILANDLNQKPGVKLIR